MSAYYYLPLWFYDALECRNCSATYNLSCDQGTKFPLHTCVNCTIKLGWIGSMQYIQSLSYENKQQQQITHNYIQTSSQIQKKIKNTMTHCFWLRHNTFHSPKYSSLPFKYPVHVILSHQYPIRLTSLVVVVLTITWWTHCITFLLRAPLNSTYQRCVMVYTQKKGKGKGNNYKKMKIETINVKYLELAAQ